MDLTTTCPPHGCSATPLANGFSARSAQTRTIILVKKVLVQRGILAFSVPPYHIVVSDCCQQHLFVWWRPSIDWCSHLCRVVRSSLIDQCHNRSFQSLPYSYPRNVVVLSWGSHHWAETCCTGAVRLIECGTCAV